MKKNLFLFLLLTFSIYGSFAQLRSPDEFLGNPIGVKFTPHFTIVNYFQHTIDALPQQMKLQLTELENGNPKNTSTPIVLN